MTSPRKATRKVAAPKIAPEPSPAATDAELAILALYAEDAFYDVCQSGGDLKSPSPDPRLSPRWKVLGTLTAIDAPFRFGKYKVGAREVFYGWHLQSGSEHVLAIRGTATYREWLVDAVVAPKTAHAIAGRVESGFWSVYESLRIDGKPIRSIQGPVTVVGHSLGAAIATYASLELATRGVKVRGVFIASPHPGDARFCKAFGAVVPDHVMYANEADLIPRVPWWFGYSDVPNVRRLSAGPDLRITGGKPGQHHVLSYIALMDRDAFRVFRPLPIDEPFLDCVHLVPRA